MQKKPREISDFNTAFLYYPARSDSLFLLRKKIFITISHHLCLILKILFMLIDQCRKDDPGKPADDSCQDHKPADDQCRDLFHCSVPLQLQVKPCPGSISLMAFLTGSRKSLASIMNIGLIICLRMFHVKHPKTD